MSLNEKESAGIRAELIIEVVGRPANHLTETLEKITGDIDKEKGVKVLKKKIHEPKQVKDQQEFFSDFAEIEIEVEDILYLVVVMFKYMPANIEIISPEVVALTNNGWNDILNELARRLHGYDEVARILQIEKGILEKRLREVLEKSSENNLEKNSKKEKKNKSKK